MNPQAEGDPQEPEHDRGGERIVERRRGAVLVHDGRQRRDPDRRGEIFGLDGPGRLSKVMNNAARNP